MSRNAKPTATLQNPRLDSTLTGLTLGKTIVTAASSPRTLPRMPDSRPMALAKLGRSRLS